MKIGEAYGFVPNLSISNHLNAHHVLSKTPTEVYFAHFTNKLFHNLTSSKSIPSAATSILGFGLKFIPVPKKSIRQTDVNEAIKRFDRNFYLEVHFADDNVEEDEESVKKLQVNSTWKPDQPPYKITQRLGQFEGAISCLLHPQQGKLNLTKFQASILQQICSNPNIIIAHADKNLGPVGVNTKQYIRWSLDEHLSDSETYVQVSEGNAQLATSDLYTEIYKWTHKHSLCDKLTKDAIA
jgi:hypothetical protein